jgi:hypothetical protein
MHALKPDPDSEEEDEAFLRRLIFPEEDRHLFSQAITIARLKRQVTGDMGKFPLATIRDRRTVLRRISF